MRERRRWTLRTRLLVTVLAITAAGLAAFGILTTTLLDRAELTRLDDQLNAMAGDLSSPNRTPPSADSTFTPHWPATIRVMFFDNSGMPTDQLAPGAPRPQLPAMDVESVRARSSQAFTEAATEGSGAWRVRTIVQLPSQFEPQSGTVAIALSLDTFQATARELREIEVVAGVALLVVLAFAALWLVRIGLVPLTNIERTAGAIADGDIDRRVTQVDERTEVGRLGAALNIMLGRLSSTMRDLKSTMENLESSQARLRIFVADASHELRTPLTSIRGYAELYRLGGGATADDAAEMMRHIENEAARMGLLVDDLLLLARLDEERPSDLTEVDLVSLVDNVIHDAGIRYPERVVRLDFPSGPQHVVGDRHRLRQVLTNLLSNALTHTPSTATVDVVLDRWTGPLDVSRVAAQAGILDHGIDDFVVLEVRDNGPGIPAEKAPYVFDRFYRVDESSPLTGGSGLGLAIVAAILSAHSAAVQLVTAPGEGTTFRILFPDETR